MAMKHIFYGGNGVPLFTSAGRPYVGVFYAVEEQDRANAKLWQYSYQGDGRYDPSGSSGWYPRKRVDPWSHAVWDSFQHILGCGDGVILGILPNGDLRWHKYRSRGWHPYSGKYVIGTGWQNFRHILGSGGTIFGVDEDGNLRWYQYTGDGQSRDWHPHSSNRIDFGWEFRTVFGGVSPSGGSGHVFYAVEQNGDLRWHKYSGNGENDPTGSTGWVPNSGNIIGNGW
jgi:hypothetical protein